MDETITIRFPWWFWDACSATALLCVASSYLFMRWYARWYERKHPPQKP